MFGFTARILSTSGGTVSEPAGGEVTIDGGTLVTSSGQAYSGDANVAVTSFDPDDGRWHEEGTFTRDGGHNRGRVRHFSVWNCDVAASRCYVNGRVVDGQGQPVQGARVTFYSHRSGGGFVSSGETSTPADRRFRVPVDANATMTYWAERNGVKSATVQQVGTCEPGVEETVPDI